eukprot:402479-Pelagomonas_calceolata.AAC.3
MDLVMPTPEQATALTIRACYHSMRTERHNIAGRMIIKLFIKALGEQARRPGAIMPTPYNAKPTPPSSSSSFSHHVSRSMHSAPHMSNATNRIGQPHQLSVNQTSKEELLE